MQYVHCPKFHVVEEYYIDFWNYITFLAIKKRKSLVEGEEGLALVVGHIRIQIVIHRFGFKLKIFFHTYI